MSSKSISVNRSTAVQLENRKHPQRYKDEQEELDTNEAENEWLLARPEWQVPKKAA